MGQAADLNQVLILLWRMGLGPVIGQVFTVLTTTDRVTGEPRHTALEYHTWRTRKYVVCAEDASTEWAQDIGEQALVTLQTASGTGSMMARRVTEAVELLDAYAMVMQRPALKRWFEQLLGAPLSQDAFLSQADRYHLVTFDPTSEPTPEAVCVDRWWIWLVVAAVLGVVRLLGSRAGDD